MSKKNGFSMLETITPMVVLLPPARCRACRLGWYFSSSTALMTRARVEFLTTLALLSTRETVAVDTLARRATCSKFMVLPIVRERYSGAERTVGSLTGSGAAPAGAHRLQDARDHRLRGQFEEAIRVILDQ